MEITGDEANNHFTDNFNWRWSKILKMELKENFIWRWRNLFKKENFNWRWRNLSKKEETLIWRWRNR